MVGGEKKKLGRERPHVVGGDPAALPHQKISLTLTGPDTDAAHGLMRPGETAPAKGKVFDEKIEAAYRALTNRQVRRGHNPDPTKVELIKQNIENCIQSGQPVNLVVFWGGHKESETGLADLADEKALDLIKGHVERLKSLGIKAKATLFFTDVHSTHLNGKTDMQTGKYHRGISRLAEQRGLEIVKASETLPYKKLHGQLGTWKAQLTYIGANFGQAMPEPRAGASFLDNAQILYREWTSNGETTRKRLFGQAQRHSDKAGDLERTERVVQRYIAHRLFEAENLPRIFPNSVFITYSHPSSHSIQPAPTIFTYSLRKGIGECPWFMDQSAGSNPR
ncbi:MAG: hypothetical protein ABH950_00800 [Candidatus Altiarchaeota archaeon]